MDTILAKRNLAKETNTAQVAVDQKIQQMAISSSETEFSVPDMPIAGDINVSKLSPLNIVSVVTKSPGHITGITGIPESVRTIKFEKQLLVEISQLPKSLEILNLSNNYIEQIDLSNLNKLKILKLNNNRLKNLGLLPESLEEIYIDNNKIKLLNLDNLVKLRVLHCRNNRTMRIENIPRSIVDIQVEEGNPQIILDYEFIPNNNTLDENNERTKGTESEFLESLNDYFTLKTKYEQSLVNLRQHAKYKAFDRGLNNANKISKMIKRLRPKCVNCKRPVGTVFKTRENRFIAYCGDSKDPCELRIELFKGDFESDDKFAEYIQQSLQETKEKIIRQKMDVLFNYSSEEETVAKFKDLIEDYNLLAFLHKTDLDMREDKRFNLHKRELIKSKMKLISEIKQKMNTYMEEYETSENRDALHSAMDIYIREYMPETNNLRMLKYSVMEMIVPANSSDNHTRIRVLNQSPVSIKQLEMLHGEVPKVIKYVTGLNKQSRTTQDINIDAKENDEYDVEEEEQPEGEEEIPFEPIPIYEDDE